MRGEGRRYLSDAAWVIGCRSHVTSESARGTGMRRVLMNRIKFIGWDPMPSSTAYHLAALGSAERPFAQADGTSAPDVYQSRVLFLSRLLQF